jgi:branched-chain amino acid transport system substrate-binding protein
MDWSRRIQRTGTCVLLSLVAVALLGMPWALAQEPIKVGFVTSLTGPYGSLAEDQVRGLTLAQEEAKASGGVLGRPVELLVRDDQTNPGEAAKKSKELIEKDRVQFLMGCISAATQLAMNEQAKRANIPFFGVCQSNDINKAPDRGPYTLHEALTPYMTAQSLGEWVAQNLGKRWYFLAADYAWGHQIYESFVNILDKHGGTNLGVTRFPLGATDFTAYLPRIQAANPEVLIFAGAGRAQENAFKQMAAFGLKNKMKIVNPVSDLQFDIPIGFKILENTYSSTHFSWELADQLPSAKRFVEAFRQRFGTPPSGYAAYAYSALRSLLWAVEKGQSLEPDKVAQALLGTEHDWNRGRVRYRPCDHQAFQKNYIVRGRSEEEAKAQGKGEFGFREIIATVEITEEHERTCAELSG